MSKVTENIVFMDRGNYTTCSVHLHGGTILSYRVKNKEMLYMKRMTVFNHVSAIRGGIKFVFPYFGRRVNGPKHGFARYVPWNLEEGPTTKEDGNIEAVFSLKDSEYTKAIWNYNFKISYRLTLCMNELRVAVKVENTSKYFPFNFTILRHSIFQVANIRNCEIYGLTNCKYLNANKRGMVEPKEQKAEKLIIDRSYMDVFVDVPSQVEVHKIDDNGLKLRVKAVDPTVSDVLIYNPWTTNLNEAEDSLHYDEEYLYCLGVGNGCLNKEIRLEPKETWQSLQVIEVVDDAEEKKIEQMGQLLDNPLELFKDTCMKTEFVYSTSI